MRDDFLDDPHVGLAAQRQSAVHEFPLPHASSTSSSPPLVDPETKRRRDGSAGPPSPEALAREAENQASIEEMLRINGVTTEAVSAAPKRRRRHAMHRRTARDAAVGDDGEAEEEARGAEGEDAGEGDDEYESNGDARSGYDEEEEYAEELDVLDADAARRKPEGPGRRGTWAAGQAHPSSLVYDLQVTVACTAVFALVGLAPLEPAIQRYVPALRQRVPRVELVLRTLAAGLLMFVVKRYVLPGGTPP